MESTDIRVELFACMCYCADCFIACRVACGGLKLLYVRTEKVQQILITVVNIYSTWMSQHHGKHKTLCHLPGCILVSHVSSIQ